MYREICRQIKKLIKKKEKKKERYHKRGNDKKGRVTIVKLVKRKPGREGKRDTT